jgi:ATP-dependent protease Clp ATPase subunit
MACSFCGKPDAEVANLVAGPQRILRRVYICDACVAIAVRLMAEPDANAQSAAENRPSTVESPNPASTLKGDSAKRIAFA